MKAISKCRPCACTRRADPEEMEHRATAQCSLLGRHWRLQETSAGGMEHRAGGDGGRQAEEMEHRAYRPMLARGQARMPTLPKALRPNGRRLPPAIESNQQVQALRLCAQDRPGRNGAQGGRGWR